MAAAVEELRAKRRELQERREALLAETRATEADIATIDRCIVLLDPAAAPSDPPPRKRAKRPSIPFADREFSTLVADALRTAAGPVNTAAVVEAPSRRRGGRTDRAPGTRIREKGVVLPPLGYFCPAWWTLLRNAEWTCTHRLGR